MNTFLSFLLAAAIALLPSSPATALPASTTPSPAAPQLHITWLGGPTLLVEFNGFRFITDPMLGEGKQAFRMGDPNEPFDLQRGPNIKHHRRLTALPEVHLEGLSLILLSHAHEDHFDQQAQRRLPNSLPLIAPEHDLQSVRDKGFVSAQSLPWSQRRTFTAGAGEIHITAVPAYHSAQPEIDQLLGKGNGYWIEFSQGNWRKTVYWTGDTLPTSDLIDALRTLGRPDVLIPHLGRVGTPGPLGQISMSVSDAIKLAEALRPRKLLPIHHSSYALYLEPIAPIAEQSAGRDFGLDLISEGTTVSY